MILDELEVAHQFVAPAKNLAACRRTSRSLSSLTCSALEAAGPISGRTIRVACDSCKSTARRRHSAGGSAGGGEEQ